MGTHGPAVNGGDTGTPADRAQATIQWAKGPFTATATINYIGRFNVLDPSAAPPNNDCQTALFDNNASGARWTKTGVAPSYCNVASFTYVNFNFQYAANKNWTLMASILNAFNAKPPFDFETYGAPGSNYPDNHKPVSAVQPVDASDRRGRPVPGALGSFTIWTRRQRRSAHAAGALPRSCNPLRRLPQSRRRRRRRRRPRRKCKGLRSIRRRCLTSTKLT